MAGPNAALSPDEGAETPVLLALLPPGSPNGEFWEKKAVSKWQTEIKPLTDLMLNIYEVRWSNYTYPTYTPEIYTLVHVYNTIIFALYSSCMYIVHVL